MSTIDMSTITDTGADLAGDLASTVVALVPDAVRDLDLPSEAVRRTRTMAAAIVPWVSPPSNRRRWLWVGLGTAAVATVILVRRRRTASEPVRDDRRTPDTGDAARRVA